MHLMRLRKRFGRTLGSGILNRVHFVRNLSPERYYRLLRVVDVVLDTPHYSSSLTGFDAFGFALPVVTEPGPMMVQRYAAGLYEAMGPALNWCVRTRRSTRRLRTDWARTTNTGISFGNRSLIAPRVCSPIGLL